ncbi:MAG: amino acid permease [archaeon]|nr:amino acid permease [archaeon]
MGKDESRITLKRVIGTYSAFSMGYADIGADIYIAIGLIAFYAGSAAPLAFLLASITYIMTGLCYAELASSYPVAGGAQFFSMRAFGNFHGFLAGWGLMLDYTVDIALFSLASVGYLSYVVQIFFGTNILLQSPYYGFVAIILILWLIVLNIIGIKWSSNFNAIFVTIDLITISLFLLLGLPTILINGGIERWALDLGKIGSNPSWNNFIYATSLAMVSYIGIESISQAAEETKNPARIIPKATKWTIITIVLFTVLVSLVSVTLLPSSLVGEHSQNPLIILANALPFIGGMLSIWIAFVGFAVCYVSTNTGVIGVSRVTFSMGRFRLFPKSFARLHSKYYTPYITITLFSLIACLIILMNNYLESIDLLSLIASLYNFGALVSYMYVNLSTIALRFKDNSERAWKVPLNITIRRGGKKYFLPILPFFGFASCLFVWLIVVGTHEVGRLLGSLWFLIGIIIYFIQTKRTKRIENSG